MFSRLKEIQKRIPEEGRSLTRFLKIFIPIIIGLSVAYIYVKVKKDVSTDIPYPTIIIYTILENLLVISIGILSSIIATYFFSVHSFIYQIKAKDKYLLQEKFIKFFRCNLDLNLGTIADETVAIILPSYHSLRSQKVGFDEIVTEIKKDIEALEKPESGLKKSIKVFRDSAAISFAQSDMIAATNIAALFSRMEMIIPTIRTDVQGLLKYFQDNNEDYKIKKNVDVLISNIKQNLPETEYQKYNEDQWRERISNLSKRNYKTYISIGMFSNIFMMDLINSNEKEIPFSEKRPFECKTIIENGKIKRILTIYREKSDPYKTDTVPLPQIEITKDYALVARVNIYNKSIFILAGVTVHGTEAAAHYLIAKWQEFSTSIGEEPFALVLDVNTADKYTYVDIANKTPLYWYPLKLIGNN